MLREIGMGRYIKELFRDLEMVCIDRNLVYTDKDIVRTSEYSPKIYTSQVTAILLEK